MALFEGYDRRIKQIDAYCKELGIKDIEEAQDICNPRVLIFIVL
jgi:hypothetical protein